MDIPDAQQRSGRKKYRNLGMRLSVAIAVAVMAAGAVAVGAQEQAHAQDGATWDRLAGCESGGNWRADTGNGYSGGLQFSDASWRAYGGAAYAPRAASATRSQQIAVAERALRSAGWGTWPACSARLGLRGTAPRPVTPTVPRPAPQAPERIRPQRPQAPERVQAPERIRPPERVRPPAPERVRPPARVVAPPPSVPHTRRKDGKHIVSPGETLSTIAGTYNRTWPGLYRQNREEIGKDPHLIFPGTRLVVSPPRTD